MHRIRREVLIAIILIFTYSELLYSDSDGLRTPMAFNESSEDRNKIKEIFAELEKQDYVMSLASITQEMVGSGWLERMIENKLVFDVNVDDVELIVPLMKILSSLNKDTKYKHGYVGFRSDLEFTENVVLLNGKKNLKRHIKRLLKKLVKINKSITQRSGGLHNFYVEIPATAIGIEVGKRAIAKRLNVKWSDISTIKQYEACVKAYKEAKEAAHRKGKLKTGPYGVSFAGIIPSSIDVQNFYFIFLKEYIYDHEWKRFSRENDIALQRISWERKEVIKPGEIQDVRFSGTVSNVSPGLVKAIIEQMPLHNKTGNLDIFFRFDNIREINSSA